MLSPADYVAVALAVFGKYGFTAVTIVAIGSISVLLVHGRIVSTWAPQ